jgi:hypothetical protein
VRALGAAPEAAFGAVVEPDAPLAPELTVAPGAVPEICVIPALDHSAISIAHSNRFFIARLRQVVDSSP